ncbi:heavy-metal-associated domain-containing protein [Methylovorus mays]|uniref:heavy-metal-associated domain-containing protein n=1 Tax=Methylovorus mays TaxID=184077 RepID=UPI001E3F5E69|nr:heavy-metal-associated domain-containing protein [Methylovorus mays]MCB5207434.1 heavy-metal-associated domain-containing protein [Methylovorus mays]
METFKVEGMVCGGCVNAVTRAIQNEDAGARVEVDLASGKLTTESALSKQQVAAIIEEAGYTVVG